VSEDRAMAWLGVGALALMVALTLLFAWLAA